MIACDASNQLSAFKFATQPGRPVTIRSIGSGSMMTPVENGNTCSGSQPSSLAASAQVTRALAMPSSPVPALALPVFTTSARIPLPAARCSRATITGAAQKRFCVNTPATVDCAAICMTSKSLRLGFLILASVVPSSTPLIGSSSEATGGFNLTGIFTL